MRTPNGRFGEESPVAVHGRTETIEEYHLGIPRRTKNGSRIANSRLIYAAKFRRHLLAPDFCGFTPPATVFIQNDAKAY